MKENNAIMRDSISNTWKFVYLGLIIPKMHDKWLMIIMITRQYTHRNHFKCTEEGNHIPSKNYKHQIMNKTQIHYVFFWVGIG